MSRKNIRNMPGHSVQDLGSIPFLTYNESAGAQKNMDMGHNLLPIPTPGVGVGYSTDATTLRSIGAGKTLAVYNNNAAVGSITLGVAGQASLAPGVADAGGAVGIPCAPASWTYISLYLKTHAIASAATLLCFIVNDESSIRTELPNEPS